MTRPQLPEGTYEGIWTFGVTSHETYSLRKILQRRGRMHCRAYNGGDSRSGEAEIDFEKEEGSTFTRSLPVRLHSLTEGIEIGLDARLGDLIPISRRYEVVRFWGPMKAALEDDRLSGSTDP